MCLFLLIVSLVLRSVLAQNDNLQVHEEKNKGVYVKGLSDYYVSNAKEVYEIMRQGGNARVVTATSEYHNLCHDTPLNNFRYECREFTIPFDLLNYDQPEEYRYRRTEDGKSLSGRSGWIRKGRKNRRIWSDPRRSQEDQQVAIRPWYGH